MITWIAGGLGATVVACTLIFSIGHYNSNAEIACIESGKSYSQVDIIGDNTEDLVGVCIVDTPPGYGR